MTYHCLLLGLTLLLTLTAVPSLATTRYAEFSDDSRKGFWIESGQQSLRKALQQDDNTNLARNVIVFVGDGMGIPSITASRIYKGQKSQQKGEESVLVFEKFPHVALIKTYNVDRQVPDSAGTATAIFTGVKTNYETLGLSPQAERSNCRQSKQWHIDSVLTWAQMSGRSTGIVTTTRITHATPASLYSHVAHRDWECDSAMPANASECKDIARQMVEDQPGNRVNVILGGGRRNFLNATDGGKRLDGANLIEAWINRDNSTNRKYVSTGEEFRALDPKKVDNLLGLFTMDHMDYELDRRKQQVDRQPSLREMTAQAIKILQKNPKGFFLHVEGGRIDHAHHDNNAKRAFEDTIAFEKAIQQAIDMTSKKDTLIIVTADHSHVMTINGYPERGKDILGTADVSDIDKLPYTTIMYTTGPGYKNNTLEHRGLLKNAHTTEDNYTQLTLVPMKSETHGGEDVAVYAQGPYAHLFQGVQEQNYITHVINFASCMGPQEFLKNCDVSGATFGSTSSFTSVLSLIVVTFSWYSSWKNA